MFSTPQSELFQSASRRLRQSQVSIPRRLILSGMFAVVLAFATGHRADAGQWVALTNQYPLGQSGLMLLLTDGTVMVQGSEGSGGVSSSWYRLTPDSQGNYVAGTWSAMASMSTQRLYMATQVMPNGNVFVLGGEYSGAAGDQNLTNTGEIYNTLTNTWSPITYPLGAFGDDESVLLPSGKILCAYPYGPQTYLFNPANNTFTQSGTKLRNDASDEETWVLLYDGSVVSYDIFSSPATGAGYSQRYNALSGTWVDAGSVPVPLTGANYGEELGGASVLPNGNVIFLGANNNTAIYNPATNTWAAGPTMPANMGADDAPSVMGPDGLFLMVIDSSSPADFTPPCIMMSYNYANNTLSDITSTLPSALQSYFSGNAAYYQRFLVLPNGHILLNDGSGTIWDYTPSASPNTSWKPTITSIAKGTGANSGSYTLTGTQLNGFWQGAVYGDDAQMSTNYPIISLKNPSTGKVYYCRTTNWTPGVTTVGSTATSTVTFTTPTGIANGTYQLTTSANGISSSSTTFTLPFTTAPPSNYVSSSYNTTSKVLTLTGDTGANSVSITQRGTIITVTGAGATLIGTSLSNSQQVSYNISGNFTIVCNFNQSATPATNDSVSLISVDSSNVSMTFGSGNDAINLTYCALGTFTLNGGGGTNTATVVASTITTKNITSATLVP